MMITEVFDNSLKQQITRLILEVLPDWFGIKESRENYIRESEDCIFFAAYEQGKPVGFICLKETGRDTVEIYVMGVLKEYHRQSIGRKLFEYAEAQVRDEAEVILLSTATKNWRAVLHFYLEELDLEFWSATLFKRLNGASLHEK